VCVACLIGFKACLRLWRHQENIDVQTDVAEQKLDALHPDLALNTMWCEACLANQQSQVARGGSVFDQRLKGWDAGWSGKV